ncbi:GAF domain-containing sensor histidine kinase [Mucilaginibacter sp.]|uniref:GAF domain-containing sensor histidine kinase n=1 Tax=Mucilaginibacter sp. TaxID=1882438 RepID=UPI000CAAD6DE|nr:GAF domain-containing sensor histidine kinase [Mucilaginibacter sp.]PLW89444.1 MAG: histidine kinase [Mucilaginibacter sp.]HEK21703.1 GAF domain-containing sensor histidine kinase [Bacteroidota bacterium]
MQQQPIPNNEMGRIIELSDYDLDYSSFQDAFKDLAKLAAKVAGTSISLVNLIDSFTQWSITNHGIDLQQMPREDSVCQYTIVGDMPFEIKDLTADERFKDKFYVTGGPKAKYYLGVPLRTDDGHNIGALCVLDDSTKTLPPEKVELLKIIADEIVNRLKAYKVINGLKNKLHEADESRKKVAHDIRGPLGGIIGLAQVISEQGHENEIEEVLEFINLIQRSGRSLLDLADEILSTELPKRELRNDEFTLDVLKEKLEHLYMPQARNKNIGFVVNTSVSSAGIPFSKNKLLQIIGNLVSNAMKFTPEGGKVSVDLSLKIEGQNNALHINVADTGEGLSEQVIENILGGKAESTNGTGGEQGYGFGLALVKHLVESLKGTMRIYSQPGKGANFEIVLPQVIK